VNNQTEETVKPEKDSEMIEVTNVMFAACGNLAKEIFEKANKTEVEEAFIKSYVQFSLMMILKKVI
jgi:hypothetical protein